MLLSVSRNTDCIRVNFCLFLSFEASLLHVLETQFPAQLVVPGVVAIWVFSGTVTEMKAAALFCFFFRTNYRHVDHHLLAL